MKLKNLELTEFIKENYSYNTSKEFYEIQDIILLTDYLLKDDRLKRSELLKSLEEIKKGDIKRMDKEKQINQSQ